MLTRRFLTTTAAVVLVAAGATACGDATGLDVTGRGDTTEVAAGFYAVEYAASRIGGDRVTVTGLTKQTALDYRNDNILCSQIDIGNAATPLTDRMVEGQGVLQPDGRMMKEARMNADDVGKAVVYIANLPLDTNVLFMTVMANGMPFVGRG